MFRDCGFYHDVNCKKEIGNTIKAFENAMKKEMGYNPIDDLPNEVSSNTIRAFENASKVKSEK